MSNKNRKHPEKKKSDIDLKSWLLGAITDLVIGIILLILDKLLKYAVETGNILCSDRFSQIGVLSHPETEG